MWLGNPFSSRLCENSAAERSSLYSSAVEIYRSLGRPVRIFGPLDVGTLTYIHKPVLSCYDHSTGSNAPSGPIDNS